MGKEADTRVRSHAQEREWLLSLGEGDIIEALSNLVAQLIEDEDLQQEYLPKSKRHKKGKQADTH